MRTDTVTLIAELLLVTDGNPKERQSATPALAGADCNGKRAAIRMSTTPMRFIDSTVLNLVNISKSLVHNYQVIN